jgi:hypothetical protein
MMLPTSSGLFLDVPSGEAKTHPKKATHGVECIRRMAETMIPIFRVSDGYETARWYSRWGFTVVSEHRFAPELPLYLFLERNGVQLHLSEHTGDATPGTLVYFWVDDVDGVAAELGAEVHDQPWGRETKLIDPDGNRLRVATGHDA